MTDCSAAASDDVNCDRCRPWTHRSQSCLINDNAHRGTTVVLRCSACWLRMLNV